MSNTTYSYDEIKAALSINDIEDDLYQQAAILGRWGWLAARAADLVRRRSVDRDELWASIYQLYKKKHPDSKENEAKAHVFSHPSYKTAVRQLLVAETHEDTLKRALKALETKTQMLTMLSARQGKEMEVAGRGQKREERD